MDPQDICLPARTSSGSIQRVHWAHGIVQQQTNKLKHGLIAATNLKLERQRAFKFFDSPQFTCGQQVFFNPAYKGNGEGWIALKVKTVEEIVGSVPRAH